MESYRALTRFNYITMPYYSIGGKEKATLGMKENKQKILDLLLPALQATRELHDLKALTYINDSGFEGVIAEFSSGGKKYANTAMDSGIAMIRDTLRQIG